MDLQQIGKYRLLGRIGHGAMGEVFKAEDPILNRLVAVKTISGSMAPHSDLRKRFLREAQSAARLNHPNIITIYDFGEEQDRVYMAMELLEGVDLKEAIRTRALASLDESLEVMEQICDGLAFAHAKGVIHRDLKPANIHLQPDGSVKIMDFGLARLGESEMTATGMILGTPHYMSPEQVRGEKADARSDVFSIGAVFYELLGHHKAFDSDSVHSILFQVLEHKPAPLRRWVPELPPLLMQLVDKALEKDAALRFQSGGELREALRGVRRALRTGQADAATLAALAPSRAPSAAAPAEVSRHDAATHASLATSVVSASRGSLAPQLDTPRPAVPPPEAYSETVIEPGSQTRPRARRPSAAPAPAARSAATSYVLLATGAGALALIVAAVVGFFWLRSGDAGPETGAGAGDRLGALTEALVTSQVELARKNLDDKQYGAAAKQAEQALRLDSSSVAAQEVLREAQARVSQVEAAADEARRALEAGNVKQATVSLSRVLALDPRHPVAAELSERLNRHFRAQAEEARGLMAAAREGAGRARAESLRPFTDAVALGAEADGLHRQGEYAVAAQKFLAARDGFEQARRTAVAQAQAARTAGPPVAPRPAAPTPLRAEATAPAAAPVPTAWAPTPTPPMALPTPPPTVTPAVVSEEPAIRQVIEDYKRALETRDLGLFRAVKPNLSGQEEKTLRATFAQVKSHQVQIALGPIQVEGGQARVRLTRQDTVDGKSFTFQQSLVLVKGPSGWTIREIGR